MKQDENGELHIEATGQQQNEKITFPSINLSYGIYTLGWKNSITGLIDQNNQSLKFYPNPSEDQLTLSGFSEILDQVYLHDITGQLIPVFMTKRNKEIILDTQSLVPGMYVLILSEKNGTDKQSLRFIKQ